MHGLVATCYAKSPCVLPLPVPQLLSGAAAISCSPSEWCRKFVRRAALPISVADRNWLKNLLRQIALYEVGGNWCRNGQSSRLLSARRAA